MTTKNVCTLIAIASLVTPAVVLASLPAPTQPDVYLDYDEGTFTAVWSPVDGATKYCVELEGIVAYGDPSSPSEAPVQVSFSSTEAELDLTLADVAAAIADQLGVAAEDLISATGSIKVKAMNPGKGAGRQNNPFSEPVSGTLFLQ